MITFKIEPDTVGFHTWSPELPGCHTHGATRAEALANLKDAVQLYLEDVMERNGFVFTRQSQSSSTPSRKGASCYPSTAGMFRQGRCTLF